MEVLAGRESPAVVENPCKTKDIEGQLTTVPSCSPIAVIVAPRSECFSCLLYSLCKICMRLSRFCSTGSRIDGICAAYCSGSIISHSSQEIYGCGLRTNNIQPDPENNKPTRIQ